MFCEYTKQASRGQEILRVATSKIFVTTNPLFYFSARGDMLCLRVGIENLLPYF